MKKTGRYELLHGREHLILFMRSIALIFIFNSFLISTGSTSLDDEYSPEFVNILENVYGGGFLSQGGTHSLDQMFDGIELEGKNILDIGCGLGGADIYLAEKYSCIVTGIDAVEHLIEKAQATAKQSAAASRLLFTCVTCEEYDFTQGEFDIIFSKEVFLHFPHKRDVIQKIYKALKPGGIAVILDWVTPTNQLGSTISAMIELDNLSLHMAVSGEYENLLSDAGFCTIKSTSLNELYIGYTSDNLAYLESNGEKIGAELYSYAINSWGKQKQAFSCGEILATLLVAQKPLLKSQESL
jgi:2-polyprenyl-3-methyl-5-hydroxy-6-metoxy-1,4-benzoquinol methylase